MNPFINLFRRKEKRKLIWKGAISSSGPQQQGPITVLALRTENDKKEFDEGCIDAQIDFHNNVPMPMNLNYPFHPYARGYVETYRGLIGK